MRTIFLPSLFHVTSDVLRQVEPKRVSFDASLANASREIELAFNVLEGCLSFQALLFS